MLLPNVKSKLNSELHTPVAMAIATEYAKKLDFVSIVNSTVSWDKKQCHLTPGQLALSIVLSTFSQIRSPLYHISQNFEHMDTQFLFGQGVDSADLSDDALGRMLDKIYEAGSTNLFSKIALNAYSRFSIPFHNLHSDTTSISLYGDYPDCEKDEYVGIEITEGFSKDHRPDLKQFMVGNVVNEHGVPLYSKILDGNTSDCIWNQETIVSLQELLGEALQDKVYIADSKAITRPNLLLFTQPGKPLYLLSRCPDHFHKKIAGKIKQKAYTQKKWLPIGKLIDDKHHTSYEGQEFEETLHLLDDKQKLHLLPVRFFVYRSNEAKLRVEKRLQKETKQLQTAIVTLEKKVFACAADAQQAADDFIQSQRKILIDIQTSIHSQTKETIGRGRIGKNPRPMQLKTSWFIAVNIVGPNPITVRQAEDKAESFVLMTTAPPEKLSLETALWEYKGQHKVEVAFHLLKQPALAARVFLKKPERIEALCILLQVGLLIRSLMQYNAREREKQITVLPRFDFDNKILQKPTAQKLLELLKPIILVNQEGTYSYLIVSSLEHQRFEYICYLLDISIG